LYVGTAKNDTLLGTSKNDCFVGQGGSDTFTGGEGRDTFIINDFIGVKPSLFTNYTIVTDFSRLSDVIVLQGQSTEYSWTQRGSDVFISHSGQEIATLQNSSIPNFNQGFNFFSLS
jgi:Ca2+-binding RTX toxin-like protein